MVQPHFLSDRFKPYLAIKVIVRTFSQTERSSSQTWLLNNTSGKNLHLLSVSWNNFLVKNCFYICFNKLLTIRRQLKEKLQNINDVTKVSSDSLRRNLLFKKYPSS